MVDNSVILESSAAIADNFADNFSNLHIDQRQINDNNGQKTECPLSPPSSSNSSVSSQAMNSEDSDVNNHNMSSSSSQPSSYNSSYGSNSAQKLMNLSNTSISALIPGGVITTQNISTVIRPKGNNNSLQFVRIQTPDLSKKAVEQIKLSDSKDKIKEVEEEWQNNLLNWKSKRRQQLVNTVEYNPRGSFDINEGDANNHRKVKTFAEMLDQRAKVGTRLGFNLMRYIENDDENGSYIRQKLDFEDDKQDEQPEVDQELNSDCKDDTIPKNNNENKSINNNYESSFKKLDDTVCDTASFQKCMSQQNMSNEIPLNSTPIRGIRGKPIQTSKISRHDSTDVHRDFSDISSNSASEDEEEEEQEEEEQRQLQRIAFEAKLKAFENLTKPAPIISKPAPRKLIQVPILCSKKELVPVAPLSRKDLVSASLSETIDVHAVESEQVPPIERICNPQQLSPKVGQLTNEHELNETKQSDSDKEVDVVDKDDSHSVERIDEIDCLERNSANDKELIDPQVIQKSPFSSNATYNFDLLKQNPINETANTKSKINQDGDRTVLSVSGRKRCSSCREELGRGAAAFVVESLSLVYHTNCFRCSVCHVNLSNGFRGVDVRVHAGALHCQDCYSKDGLNYSRV